MTDLTEGRRLLAAATQGPWEWEQPLGRDEMPVLRGADGKVCDFGDSTQYYPTEGRPPSDEDAALIVWLRNNAPALLAAAEERDRLREALETLRRTGHDECDDCWYSCPKHPNYCGNDDRGHCSCGTDRVNDIIDAALAPRKGERDAPR